MAAYDFNGIQYPGVTTVLDSLGKGDGLLYWAVNCALSYIRENYQDDCDLEELLIEAKGNWKNVKTEAADTGSEVHGMIEQYIKAKLVGRDYDSYSESNDQVAAAFIAFLDWEKENVLEWIESEKHVYCPLNGYAGTLDAVVRLKSNKIYVVDFKSSRGFYDGYDMQISAYRSARQNLADISGIKMQDRYGNEKVTDYPAITIDGMGVLRLDKETGFPEFKDYSKKYEQSLTAFHALCAFYYKTKKRRLKNNPFVLKKA